MYFAASAGSSGFSCSARCFATSSKAGMSPSISLRLSSSESVSWLISTTIPSLRSGTARTLLANPRVPPLWQMPTWFVYFSTSQPIP